MIRINFVADEVEHEQREQLRKFIMLIYCLVWAATLFLVFLQFEGKHSELQAYKNRNEYVKSRIIEISPRFKQQLVLFRQRNQYRQKITKHFSAAVESGYILNCLEVVAAEVPENIWLEGIQISAPDGQDKTKKPNNSKLFGNRMIISGNSFFDITGKNEAQIKQFQEAIEKHPPFKFAKTQLDMQNIKLQKLNERFYHNFKLEFKWDTSIL